MVGRDERTDSGFWTDPEDYPVLSSSKDRMRSAEGVPVSFAAGNRSMVIVNLGMLRFV